MVAAMLPGLKAVIFDFDYTLADSAQGAIDCINSALALMGLPVASDEAICRTIGMSLQAAYEKLTGDSRRVRAAEFADLFIRRAGEVMVDKTVVFETVRPTVTLLKQRGLKLGIVSTKFRYRIEAILRRDGLLSCHLSDLRAADDDGTRDLLRRAASPRARVAAAAPVVIWSRGPCGESGGELAADDPCNQTRWGKLDPRGESVTVFEHRRIDRG